MTNTIDEYNSLRAEIIVLYQRRASVQNIGAALFAGLQSVAFLGKAPELSVAATFVMIAFYRDDIRWSSSMEKIGAYISEILSPRLDGIYWETMLEKVAPPDSQFQRWSLNNLVSRWPMTILVGIVLNMMLLGLLWGQLHVARVTLNVFGILVVFLLFYWVTQQLGQHNTKRVEWKKRFSDAFKEHNG